MLCLDNTDTLEGGASVASKIDYTISGLVSSTFTNLAAGQLSDTDPSVLYTAGAAISVVSIVLVNTHTSSVTVNLYLDPANGGNPRRLIPKDLSLGAGYSLVWDGARISVLDTDGQTLQTSAGGSYLANVVEDTTPELGGDLSLNGHNIDFPTTSDISDCLDQDDMSSDSATALATQQSIKAYVDNNAYTDAQAIIWAIVFGG